MSHTHVQTIEASRSSRPPSRSEGTDAANFGGVRNAIIMPNPTGKGDRIIPETEVYGTLISLGVSLDVLKTLKPSDEPRKNEYVPFRFIPFDPSEVTTGKPGTLFSYLVNRGILTPDGVPTVNLKLAEETKVVFLESSHQD